jgi:chromate reductase, NAD(P)H dehydrogenase (quinone)
MTPSTEPRPLQIFGFSGSLRKKSLNTGLLRAAQEVLPAEVRLEIFDLTPLPFYNGDLDALGLPDPVRAFRDGIAAADALLIATPEYNYSVTGVLKNAIDWASRGPNSPLLDKPVAMMGAGGRAGTALAQMHLRQMCVHNNMHPLARPQLLLAGVRDRFDAEGRLVDEEIRARIREMVEALAEWTRRLRGVN